MKKKQFTGHVDGHFVSGTLTERDEVDFIREQEENAAIAKSLGKAVKVVVGVVIGAAILAALSDQKNTKE